MLTVAEIKNAKAKDKPYKLTDGEGLYLLVRKAKTKKDGTSKLWRMKYRFKGREKSLAFGSFPDVSLAEAREQKAGARKQLRNGNDPSTVKKAGKTKGVQDSFEAVAREWHEKQKPAWTENHALSVINRLEKNIFPWIGKLSANEITAPILLESLRKIESRGAVELAHRVKQICGQVFRYAIATGRADRDPSADLRGALSAVQPKAMATITDPPKVGALMRAIEGFDGHLITRCALRLAPLTFVRPGELRRAEWNEMDLDTALWKIPEEKMKMGRIHLVPLSKQAIAILEEIQPLTGIGKYIFPSQRTSTRPMSENTINAALRRMGYSKDEITGHGFRAMASTLLHENGWNTDFVERQLAHVEGNSVKRAYNHAEHLRDRKRMMQWWADYLDKLSENKGQK